MSAKLQRSVVITKNDKGEVLEVKEVQTLNEDRINELKKQAQENSARYNALKVSKEKEEKDFKDFITSKVGKLCLVLAKVIFDNEVEKGNAETNETFEKNFEKMLNGTLSLEEQGCIPALFNEMLGGLDK